MAIYRISDILKTLQSMQDDGFEYISLSEIDSDDDDPTTLSIDAIVDSQSTENDMIDAVELPDGYINLRRLL